MMAKRFFLTGFVNIAIFDFNIPTTTLAVGLNLNHVQRMKLSAFFHATKLNNEQNEVNDALILFGPLSNVE